MAVLWALLLLAGFGLLAWWAYRSDPHWVAKDGKAFTCRVRPIGGEHMLPEGRWQDARAFVDGPRLVVRPRGVFKSGTFSAHFEIIKRAPDAPKQRAVYLVDGGGINRHEFAMIRVPASSRAVAEIDALIGAVPSDDEIGDEIT